MCPAHWKTKLANPSARLALKQALFAKMDDWHWQTLPEQYCDWRLDGKQGAAWLRVKQFTNGTLYVESTDEGALAQVQTLLGLSASPVVASAGKVTGSPPVRMSGRGMGQPVDGNLRLTGPYLGTDESGKGDYFGPLVVAGVVVTAETGAALVAKGVADCKKLSDSQVMTLAETIVQVVGVSQVAFVSLTPAIYNQTYEQFKTQGKNLNHLLAHAHGKVIAALVDKSPVLVPLSPKPVVVDQFGPERLVLNALPAAISQAISLTQLPKAEANVGVAAASIIARAKFLEGIQTLSNEIGMPLPLGASAAVNATGRRLVNAQGREALRQVAKLHFKTTQLL
jgi:ribonuclease HIII